MPDIWILDKQLHETFKEEAKPTFFEQRQVEPKKN